jgi:hypothetical protein
LCCAQPSRPFAQHPDTTLESHLIGKRFLP